MLLVLYFVRSVILVGSTGLQPGVTVSQTPKFSLMQMYGIVHDLVLVLSNTARNVADW